MNTAETTLPAAFRRVVDRDPGETALRFDGERISYANLLRRATAVANGLLEVGHCPGDPIALWLPNRPEWFDVFLASSMLGSPAVAVNSRYRSDEVKHVLEDSNATTLVVQPTLGSRDFLSMAAVACPAIERATPATLGDAPDTALERMFVVGAASDLPSAAQPFDVLRGGNGDVDPEVEAPAPNDACGVFYTSGTTSDPKGVLHNHGAVVKHARVVADWFDVSDSDVGLLVMPVYGLIGFDFAWSVLLTGGTLVCHQRFDALGAAEAVEKHGVTYLFGVGDIFEGMLETDRTLSSLERGSAILATPAQLRAVESRCGFPIVQPYGSTELHSHVLVSHPTDPQRERVRPGGPPVHHGIDVAIRDPDTGDRLPPGAQGELLVRGYPVTDGYLGNPAATAAAIDEDGWFATGDLCDVDTQGRVDYHSRLGDTLRVRGHLVSPDEIERELRRTGDVADAVVVGIETDDTQHRPVGFVRLVPGGNTTTEADLRAALNHRIADYKVPERIVIVEEYPTIVGPNGEKVKRDVLVERAATLLADR